MHNRLQIRFLAYSLVLLSWNKASAFSVPASPILAGLGRRRCSPSTHHVSSTAILGCPGRLLVSPFQRAPDRARGGGLKMVSDPGELLFSEKSQISGGHVRESSLPHRHH